MEERRIELLAHTRRNLLKGGLMAAATPWIADSSATAALHVIYPPSIGQRVLAVDNRVIGIGACHTNARIRLPSQEIMKGETGPFDTISRANTLIAQFLQVSFLSGDGDPRTVQVSDDMRSLAHTVMTEEKETIRVLRESRVFWVETNPVWLYVVGVGIVFCLYPFLDGFFSQTGSRAAVWLWNQIERTD